MTRRERLIKALIHYHYRTPPGSGGGPRRKRKMQKLRAKIAERDQYDVPAKNNQQPLRFFN